MSASTNCRYPDHHVEDERSGICDRHAEALLWWDAQEGPSPVPPEHPERLHECTRCPNEYVPAEAEGVEREFLMEGICTLCESPIQEPPDTLTIDLFGDNSE